MSAVTVSESFKLELLKRRATGTKVHEIARAAGVRPNELSGIAAGSIRVRRGDPRVVRVATFLGLRLDDCFADDQAVAS
jgi:hypothetical protein